MTMIPVAGVTLHAIIHPFWAVVGTLVLLAFAAWSYRWTRPPLPRGGRIGLAVLRGLALASVWLLAVGFEVRWQHTKTVPTPVALLVDESQSMGFKDQNGDRAATTHDVLHSIAKEAFPGRIDLKRYTFSNDLKPLKKNDDWPSPDGPVTDMEAALGGLERLPQGAPNAVVLLSDGAVNRGGSPAAAARELGVPVFTIAIGDSLPPRDLVISSLIAPDAGYTGEALPLDVTVRGTGADEASTEVRVVTEDGRVLARKTVRFAGNWSEKSLRFELTPEKAGVETWRIEVKPVSDEVNTENNVRRAVVRVAERRRAVLLLAGTPNPDFGAFVRDLDEDRDTDARALAGAGRMNRAVLGEWSLADDLSRYDAAVVFLQGPWGQHALEVLNRVAASKLPLAVITGAEPEKQALTTLSGRLGKVRPAPVESGVEIVPAMMHPLFTEEDAWFDSGPNIPPPVDLPPYRGEGETLATTTVKSGTQPVVVVPRTSPRTLAFFAAGLWRWDLARRPEDPAGRGFHDLLDRMLRWLTAKSGANRIDVHPARDLFAGGEEVELIGNVKDEGLRPVDDARVTAQVHGAGKTRTVEFQSLGGGRYVVRFAPWGEGRYTVQAQVNAGPETVRRESQFVVDRFRLEDAELRMRPDRLRAVAEASGGAFLLPGQTGRLAELLPVEEGVEEVRGAWRPFGRWLTLLLVAGLLGVEWFVRTRTGMM